MYLPEVIFTLSSVLLIVVWILFFSALLVSKILATHEGRTVFQPVSVLVCAHNACTELIKLVPAIMNQKYPEFELLIVDDGSTDQTINHVRDFQKKWQNLRLVHLPKTVPGKKAALTQGVGHSKYELILLTDADCIPRGDFWIASMVNRMDENKDIVLGYSPYFRKEGLLNRFIRFETCLNGIQYLSSALKGFTYMGVGRNLLYRKRMFDPDLFRPELPYGDDDLLISNLSRSANVAVCTDPGSLVYSEPKVSWLAYFRQRRRHYAASASYRPAHKFLLGIYHLCFILSFLLIPWIMCSAYLPWLACIFLCRLLCVWIIFARSARKLGESDLLVWFPVLEFIYFLWLLAQSPYLLRPPKNW